MHNRDMMSMHNRVVLYAVLAVIVITTYSAQVWGVNIWPDLEVDTEYDSYDFGDTITVYGKGRSDKSIELEVFAPNGVSIWISQPDNSNGTYSEDILTDEPKAYGKWFENGTYTIEARLEKQTKNTTFNFVVRSSSHPQPTVDTEHDLHNTKNDIIAPRSENLFLEIIQYGLPIGMSLIVIFIVWLVMNRNNKKRDSDINTATSVNKSAIGGTPVDRKSATPKKLDGRKNHTLSTLSTTATRQAHELNAHLMTFRDAHDQSAGKKTPRGDPAVAIRSKPMSSKRAGKKTPRGDPAVAIRSKPMSSKRAGKKTPRGDPAVAIRSKPMSSKRAGKKTPRGDPAVAIRSKPMSSKRAGKKTPRGDPAVAIRSKPMSSKRAGKKGLSNGNELLILDSSAVFFAINFNRSLRTWPHSRCLKYLTDHIKRVKIPIVVIDEVYGKIDRDGGTDEDRIKIEKFADCIDDDSSIDLNILNQLEDIQKEVVKNPNSNKAKEWRKKGQRPLQYLYDNAKDDRIIAATAADIANTSKTSAILLSNDRDLIVFENDISDITDGKLRVMRPGSKNLYVKPKNS